MSFTSPRRDEKKKRPLHYSSPYMFTGIAILSLVILMSCSQKHPGEGDLLKLFPAAGAMDVNPDTHLELTFREVPVPGTSGQIRIYDASCDTLVDVLDMSIPAGPVTRTTAPKPPYIQTPYEYLPGTFTNANTKAGTPSGGAAPPEGNYQLTIIGGFTDGFHFYPVIVHDSTAVIYPHNNLLEYGRTYYVEIDTGVIVLKKQPFRGIYGKRSWRFTTKKEGPSPDAGMIVVSADGKGDFNTVQGALDFIPADNAERKTIFVRNGVYEEIVYFRNKNNITVYGEDREKVIIQYGNREVFNPHPSNIATNEVKGTFPSRRAAFAADNCSGIYLANLTIRNKSERAQAEGLLINGSMNAVYNTTIIGSGDALQTNGPAYYEGVKIRGWGDMILGRGPAFFRDCEFISEGPFMWIRNTDANHGNVFAGCRFITPGDSVAEYARSPINYGKSYPYAEAVLINCAVRGISPQGWGPIGGDTENIHFWEYNTTNLGDGMPADVSRRHPASRQLTMEKDSALIRQYSDPSFVLDGWSPEPMPKVEF